MTNTAHILYMIGLVWISYKIFLLSDVLINAQKNKTKQRNKGCIFINIFFLFNVSRSVQFGKFGGRCKSLPCWMISWMCAATERGALLMVSRVGCCHLLSRDQSAEEEMNPSLIIQCRGGEGSLPTSLS